MEREPVESTSIAAVKYDESSSTFEVEFRNGTVYEYFDVPEQVYTAFMNSVSKGAFLNSHIRRTFRYQRI